MKSARLILIGLFLVTFVSAEKTEKWTVDDVIQAEAIGDFQVSPDGQWVVWVKSVADKEQDKRVSNLILKRLGDKREIELTRGKVGCSDPQWSRDGEYIAFISARPIPKAKEAGEGAAEPTPQLWLIRPFGGEAWNLTSEDRAVSAFRWADKETIVFAAQEKPGAYEQGLKENKDGSRVVDDERHEPPVRLFKVSVKEKKARRLSENDDRIQALEVSPDGKWAVTVRERSLSFTYDQKVRPVTFLHNLQTGEAKRILEDGKILPSQIRWTPDSKGFYLAAPFNSHPVYLMASIGLVHYFDLESSGSKPVDLGWDNGLAGGAELKILPDGFLVSLANGANPKLARYVRNGSKEICRMHWIESEHQGHIAGLDASADGKTVVYSYSTGSVPPQLFTARVEGTHLTSPLQLTDLNAGLKKRAMAKSEVVRWKGARDEEVEGVLYYPHGYEPGKKYPLVLMIHGGPAGADYDMWEENWSTPQNLMAQRGAFVLKPNYHGSSDYGLQWVESIGGGNYYDLEVPDIEKGVDSLIERGLVDAEKLGALGWSNGSILTIALTVTTTRYKLAGAGAGDVDWSSDWGNCAFGASFDNYYLGASPLEDPQLYIRKSPFFRLKNVKTPTIIFFGTEDTSVPTQQGWMHYRALQQLGQADTRFILFPGEPHGLRKLSHQRRKVVEELAWFDKYLFKSCEDKNESLKPGSPLETLVKLSKTAADHGRYGQLEKGVLIPETVEHEGIKLGRFEVTGAQFAAFDPSYSVPTGEDNLPARGIKAEQAQAYCEWLSRQTGRKYRLGKQSELEAVYSGASGKENTLDYWAGYAVNPDDAEALVSELKKLGPACLLKPVGSFPVSSECQVFDLGGNVAEWVTGKESGFVALGGSADAPADAKTESRRHDPAYIGLRVVLE